jgi:hypothetical protein
MKPTSANKKLPSNSERTRMKPHFKSPSESGLNPRGKLSHELASFITNILTGESVESVERVARPL